MHLYGDKHYVEIMTYWSDIRKRYLKLVEKMETSFWHVNVMYVIKDRLSLDLLT